MPILTNRPDLMPPVASRKKKFRKPRSQTRRIRNIEKKIRKIDNEEEVKWIDTSLDPTIINQTTNGTKLLNGILEGNSSTTRVGQEIQATSLAVKLNVYYAPIVVQQDPQRVRIMIVWDNQPNGGVPTLGGIPSTNSILDTTTITDMTLAPYNRATSERFRMVYDNMIFFPPTQLSTSAVSAILGGVGDSKTGLFILNKKFRLSRKIKYNSAGNTIADISTNSLFIYVFTNFLSNTSITTTYGIRFNFKDD